MAPFLSQWGSVTGVDYGPVGIEMAQKKYGHLAKFLLLKDKDPRQELSTLFNSFDIVVCSEVIEHAHDQTIFLKNLWDLLKPQGYCILTTPNGLVWQKYKDRELLLRHTFKIKPYLQPVENWLTPQDLIDLFQKTNFNVLNHDGIIHHVLGMPPFGKLIGLEWHLYHLLKKLNKHEGYSKGLLKGALYQCIVGQKIVL